MFDKKNVCKSIHSNNPPPRSTDSGALQQANLKPTVTVKTLVAFLFSWYFDVDNIHNKLERDFRGIQGTVMKSGSVGLKFHSPDSLQLCFSLLPPILKACMNGLVCLLLSIPSIGHTAWHNYANHGNIWTICRPPESFYQLLWADLQCVCYKSCIALTGN